MLNVLSNASDIKGRATLKSVGRLTYKQILLLLLVCSVLNVWDTKMLIHIGIILMLNKYNW